MYFPVKTLKMTSYFVCTKSQLFLFNVLTRSLIPSAKRAKRRRTREQTRSVTREKILTDVRTMLRTAMKKVFNSRCYVEKRFYSFFERNSND